MRVLLISANTERLNMPTMPLGLGFVAAATRAAGHDVRLVDLMNEPEPLGAVERAGGEWRPEAIGVSVRNIDDQNRTAPRLLLEQVRPVIDRCRECSTAPVVLGGAGYSLFPDEALGFLGADWGVRGDGERAFVALLERLGSGEGPSGLPGVHGAAGGGAAAEPVPGALDDLDAPGDDWCAGADPANPELWVPVQGRRGCPNDCSYCATWRIQGRAIRARSPRAVVDEIARLAARGFRRLYFVDNAFNMPESQGLELCRLLGERASGVRWRCILYPHAVREDLVRAMAAAGCAEVAIGFESGDEAVLRGLNKHFTPGEVREVDALLRRHGIRRTGFLLLGGPGETRESVERSLAFAESLDLDALRITTGIRIYPGTPLARRALAEGRIASEAELLVPRFYLADGLEGWLDERVTPGFFVRRPPGA